MASNINNNRISVKWVRDKAKGAYIKMPCCFICNSIEELELHHLHGITNLWNTWLRKNKYEANTDEQTIELRDDFINQHHKEIYIDVFTLCLNCHRKLHRIYGKSPALSTAIKQGLWINKQKNKVNEINIPNKEAVISKSNKGFLSQFLLGK